MVNVVRVVWSSGRIGHWFAYVAKPCHQLMLQSIPWPPVLKIKVGPESQRRFTEALTKPPSSCRETSIHLYLLASISAMQTALILTHQCWEHVCSTSTTFLFRCKICPQAFTQSRMFSHASLLASIILESSEHNAVWPELSIASEPHRYARRFLRAMGGPAHISALAISRPTQNLHRQTK